VTELVLALASETSLADRQHEHPTLARFLAGARLVPAGGPFEPRVCALWGQPETSALATLTARHDLPALPPETPLLRGDPLYLHADPNKVLTYSGHTLALAGEEADALLAGLAAEFPALELQRGAAPDRWYLRPPAGVSGRVPSAQWLHGRSLTPFLPTGIDARDWRRGLNDLQVLLHAHPINAARVARGAPPINAVWWFGGGTPPTPAPAPFSAAVGDDVLLAGLAAQAGVPWQPAADVAQVIGGCGRRVAVCGGGCGATGEGPGIDLATLESRWLPVLMAALRTRRLRRLGLVTATHTGDFPAWRAFLSARRGRPFVLDGAYAAVAA
jgi:hypothetical protein